MFNEFSIISILSEPEDLQNLVRGGQILPLWALAQLVLAFSILRFNKLPSQARAKYEGRESNH